MQHHIHEHIGQKRQISGSGFRVVTGVIFRGESVYKTTNALDGLGDLPGGTVFRSLEKHVLDEMRETAVFHGFMATAHAHPDSDSDGFHVGHRGGGDAGSVGKPGDLINSVLLNFLEG